MESTLRTKKRCAWAGTTHKVPSSVEEGYLVVIGKSIRHLGGRSLKLLKKIVFRKRYNYDSLADIKKMNNVKGLIFLKWENQTDNIIVQRKSKKNKQTKIPQIYMEQQIDGNCFSPQQGRKSMETQLEKIVCPFISYLQFTKRCKIMNWAIIWEIRRVCFNQCTVLPWSINLHVLFY